MKEYQGTVIWFNPKAGYGFIDWEGEEDLFLHFSDLNMEGFKTVKKGQRVNFQVGENNKGEPKAIEVVILE
jgi:CspA family cold shock protein